MNFRITNPIILILITLVIHPIQTHLLSTREDATIPLPQSKNHFPRENKHEIKKEGNTHQQKSNIKLLNISHLLEKSSKDELHSNSNSMNMDENPLTQIKLEFAAIQLPSDLTIRDSRAEGTQATDQSTLKQIVVKMLEKFSLRVGNSFKSYYQQVVDAMLEMRTLRVRFYLQKQQMSDPQQYQANCLSLKAASCKALDVLLGLKEELQQDFAFQGKQSQDLTKLLGFCLKEAKSLFIQLSTQISNEMLNSMQKHYIFEFTFYQSANWINSKAKKRFLDANSEGYYEKKWHTLVQKMFSIQSQFVQLIKIGSSMSVGSEQKLQAYRRMNLDYVALLNEIQEIKRQAAEDSQNANRISKSERNKIVAFAEIIMSFGIQYSSHIGLLSKSEMSGSKSTCSSTSSLSRAKSTLSTLRKTFTRSSSKNSLSSISGKRLIISKKSQTLSRSSSSSSPFRLRKQSIFKLEKDSIQSEKSQIRLEKSSMQSEKGSIRFKKSSVRSEKDSVRSSTRSLFNWGKKNQAPSMRSLSLSKGENFSSHKWRSRSQSDLGSTKNRLTLKMSARNEHHSYGQYRRHAHHQSQDKAPSHLRIKAKSLSQLATQIKGSFSQPFDKFVERVSEKGRMSADQTDPQKLLVPLMRLCEKDKHLALTFQMSKLTKTARGFRIRLFSIVERQNEMKEKDERGLVKLDQDCSELIEKIRQQRQKMENLEMPIKVLDGFQKWGALLEEDLTKAKIDVKNLLSAPLADSHSFLLENWLEVKSQIDQHYQRQVSKLNKSGTENKLLSQFSLLSRLNLLLEAIYLDIFDLVLFSNYSNQVVTLLLNQNFHQSQIISKKLQKIQKKTKKDHMGAVEYHFIKLMIRDLKMKVTLINAKIKGWQQKAFEEG